VNNINNELFPTRGIFWRTTLTALGPLRSAAKPYTDLHTDMNIYASLSDPARLIAVLRFGGGHVFSKNFEYFQAESVGADNFLRGFRKNRFSGRSMAYGSFELRGKIADIRSYILPGTLGVVAFDDVARVWIDDEVSKKWHNSYGGGLYYIPFNLFIISATVARSSEQWLFNATVGTKLNLTF
jgi:outer membrane protein assembly factor BamA